MTSRPEATDLRRELVATADSYRHIHEEHRRARPGGHTRRRLGVRLEELAAHFERLLAGSTLDETVRRQWRQRLYHDGAEPDAPTGAPTTAPHRPSRNRGRGSAPLWQR